MTQSIIWRLAGVAVLFCHLLLAQSIALAAQAPPAKRPLGPAVKASVAQVLDRLSADGNIDRARGDLSALFDQVITHAPARELDAFREAAFGLRLVNQLERTPQGGRQELLAYLRANDDLARTLAFLIRPQDDAKGIYDLLQKLRAERGTELNKFATLTAAICVVHEKPLRRSVNENKVTAPQPLPIFDYFSRNEGKMLFGLRGVPAELLIYVVDTTASIDEMNWAMSRYAGDPRVGGRFFDIKYDLEHLRTGRAKKVTTEGFNLENISKYGGVCADQAYFACSVGKSIGVPTALAIGEGGETWHAWVGFLQAQGKQGWWNFDVGRYEAYKGVRGLVIDPQSGKLMPDAYVSLLAEMIGSRPADRQAGTALTDAAHRLIALERAGQALAPPAFDADVIISPKPRTASLASQLELLELAVAQSPGDRYCWMPVSELAREGKLSLELKKKWSDLLNRQCGQKYPDFALALLAPMVETVEDVKEQNKLWNAAFDMFQKRSDLAASIRLSQAAMWEARGETDKAGLCYMDVIERYSNSGPFVIEALRKAEAALRASNRVEKVVGLYETTWRTINRPREMAGPFLMQSNWYRVGDLYAQRLEEAGQGQKAEQVRGQLTGRIGGPR